MLLGRDPKRVSRSAASTVLIGYSTRLKLEPPSSFRKSATRASSCRGPVQLARSRGEDRLSERKCLALQAGASKIDRTCHIGDNVALGEPAIVRCQRASQDQEVVIVAQQVGKLVRATGPLAN